MNGNLFTHDCANEKDPDAGTTEMEGPGNAARREKKRTEAAEKREREGRQPLQQQDDNAPPPDTTPPKGRPARRRTNNRGKWVDEHFFLIENCGDKATDDGEFTKRLHLVLNHTPPGGTRLPTEDNMEEFLNRPAQGARADNGDDEELEAIERELTSIGAKRASEISKLRKVRGHVRNGDMRKARLAIANANGLYDVTTAEGSALLQTKYPQDEERQTEGDKYRESAENDRAKELTSTGCLTTEEACDVLTKRIGRKPKGASQSATGISNDNYQDVIRRYPIAVEHIVEICNRISCGSVIDSETMEDLLRGKGTAISKGELNLRGVTTLQPILNYTGVLLTALFMDKIREVCGVEQLGLMPAGVEGNGHAMRQAVEENDNIIVGKLDLEDAYGRPIQQLILGTVEAKMPELGPYTRMQMAKKPATTIYHDRRKNATQVETQTRGVPQGGALSTAQFCITLREVTKQLLQEFGHLIKMSCISDDISIAATPSVFMDMVIRSGELLANYGMRARPDKSSIFGFGTYTDADKDRAKRLGITWVDRDAGFMCAGTPIGTPEYMRTVMNEAVDEIVVELDAMRRLALSPHIGLTNTKQLLIHIMRRCSTQQIIFLLRVTPPSATKEAAKRLDAEIANSFLEITEAIQFLPPQESEAMLKILDETFMSIRRGGHGFISADEIREGAYAGSLLQCGAMMGAISPTIAEKAANGEYTASIREFVDCVDHWKRQGLKAMTDIDPTSMWTKTVKGMQKKINRELIQRKQDRLQQTIPSGVHIHGGSPPHPTELAIRMQRLANEDPTANAWMTVNPAYYATQMANEDFCSAMQMRMCLPVMGSATHCACGADIDSQGMHQHCCRVTKFRSAVRMNLHELIKKVTWNEVVTSGDKNGKHFVDHGEPLVEDFFRKRTTDAAAHRADVAIDSTAAGGGHLVIDITTTSAMSKGVLDKIGKGQYRPGLAAREGELKKEEHYTKHYDMTQGGKRDEPTTLKTICFETHGPIGPETEKVLREIATIRAGGDEHGEQGPALQKDVETGLRQLKQKYSVSLQSWRARTMRKYRNTLVLDSRPPIPYEPGHNAPIPILPTLRYIGLPENHGRTLAVPRTPR
jgi:hypothetical protein